MDSTQLWSMKNNMNVVYAHIHTHIDVRALMHAILQSYMILYLIHNTKLTSHKTVH